MTPIEPIATISFAERRRQAHRLGIRLANDDHRRHRYTLVADRRVAARIGLRMCGREVYAFNRAYAARWKVLRSHFERTKNTPYAWSDNPSIASE